LWPEARVIACRRDPRDVALSCWTTFFGAVRWANDLQHIAERVLLHDRLMEHWRSVLPRPMIEVQYEELVAEVEQHARRLVAAIDLPWNPACLEFSSLARPVRTASLNQVRRPIYSSSVGRWRNYEVALAPCYERFALNGR